MTELFNQKPFTPLRKDLRRTPPKPESMIWSRLRNRQLKGFKFRRQVGIGRYVVDFYCPKLQLVIEIDGDSHFNKDAQAYDKERTEYFNECNIQVIRFTNTDVMKNVEAVLQKISDVASVSARIPPP